MNDREIAASDVSFGAWVQQRRKALNLTQDELARRAGCSLSAIRKIESDERRPSRQVAELLAEHLRLPPDQRELFSRVARAELRVDRLPLPAPDSSEGAAPPLRIPAPPTPLVGREPELAALTRLLDDPQCRLLTLAGPGGIGKTRLAIEAASHRQAAFLEGACFVPLASLASADFLVPAIADALGFAFQGQVEPRLQLIHHLRGKQILLVLDNVEHLLSGAGLFAEILERAPKVTLLVTSRERLNLLGEWVFEIQGLPVPPAGQAEHLDDYSATALFVQSARRARAGFELKAEERLAAARICRMVEGMPLGIELAAAWVPILSCREIAREIERNLDFLATSLRDVPARHRSLRAVFDHSWKLLAPEERSVLSRLAVLQGGFTREAAEEVADASLHLLAALTSKSLVRRAETQAGRYDLHEVVRQYALAHLKEDSQPEATTRDRHAGYYLALLRDREKALKGAAQPDAVRELTLEIDNLRAAWAWAVEREKFALLGQSARCLGWFCDMRGWLREGIEQSRPAERALRANADNDERRKALGQVLTSQSVLYFRLGQYDRARSLFDESFALLRPAGDPSLLTDPLLLCGIVMYLSGEIEQAQALLDEGIACARAAGDSWSMALGLFNRGYVASLLGRQAEAYERMQSGLAMWRTLGDPRMIALGLNFLSPVAITLGRHAEARDFLQESLGLATQVGDRWGRGTAHRTLGLLALAQGNPAEAQSCLHKSLELFSELGAQWDVARSLTYLGESAAAAGDLPEAWRNFQQAIRLASDAQAAPLVADSLVGLAHLQARAGESEEALLLAILVESHPAAVKEARDRAGQLCAELKRRLTPEQFETVQSRASAASFQSVVQEILSGP